MKRLTYFVIFLLILIECTCLFLTYKSFSNWKKNTNEIEKKIEIDNSMFAIMVEQDNGTYTESQASAWPGKDYKYNSTLSGCVDSDGNVLPGVLSFNESTRIALVNTTKTAYCYLYFDNNKVYLMDFGEGKTLDKITNLGGAIKTVEFVNYIDNNYVKNNPNLSWDLTNTAKSKAGSIMAWAAVDASDPEGAWLPDEKILYIGSNSDIYSGNLSHMFQSLQAETIKFNNLLHTAETTDMSYMFAWMYYIKSIDILDGINNNSNFDTSNVTNMSYMFEQWYGGYGNNTINLSNLNMDNVQSVENMFSGGQFDSISIIFPSMNSLIVATNMLANMESGRTLTIDLSKVNFLPVKSYSDIFNIYLSSGATLNIYVKDAANKEWVEARLSESKKSANVQIKN